MHPDRPTIKGFFKAFGADWLTKMSGPLTVPFTIGALFAPGKWLKAIFAAMAILCGGAASYGVWAAERRALCSADDDISKLKEMPDIGGEILAVFWEPFTDPYSSSPNNHSRYYIKLRLVNRNDVPCTIDEYRVLVNSIDGNHPGQGKGVPSGIGKLRHPTSGYKDEYTFEELTESQRAVRTLYNKTLKLDTWTQTRPMDIPDTWPLERARKKEGWVIFEIWNYVPSPVEAKDIPAKEYLAFPPWQQNMTVIVLDSLSKGEHPIEGTFVDVAPSTFSLD